MSGLRADSIQKLLRQCNISKNFLGCYSIDNLPPLKDEDALIVNLSRSTEPGSHFVYARCDESIVRVYDSLALSLPLRKYFTHKNKSKTLHISHEIEIPIQPLLSWMCGFYTLYFCLLYDDAFAHLRKQPRLKKFYPFPCIENDNICIENICTLIRSK